MTGLSRAQVTRLIAAVIAEEIEHGEMPPGADTLRFSIAA